MQFRNRTTNYEKRPLKYIADGAGHIWLGYQNIANRILAQLGNQPDSVVVIDLYHGTRTDEIVRGLIRRLKPDISICCEEAKLSEAAICNKIETTVTSDRVFGSLGTHVMSDFFDQAQIAQIRSRVENSLGLRVVYGVGAALVTKGDVLIYADLTRWEIQQRFRSHELDNWGVGNYDEDILRKYKRGYFLEWRVMDRHKADFFDHIDFLLDTNTADDPKMIDRMLLSRALDEFSQTPFRLIPYFDEEIWGGTWMQNVCDLTPCTHNYAWCFDGVPEENSLGIVADGIEFEMPALDLVKSRPRHLLGEKVFARFGADFPIRFDLLDTMDGDNLSLQVHPLTDYIQQHFGMHYTQDESYYILDADEAAHVYLGIRDGVEPEELRQALDAANTEDRAFDEDLYVNSFPIKRHDHVLIPAGTVHCSGCGTMVLEISATPYIFTFKLWDWGRVGLDGLPRPVNIERGFENIQFDRTTEWCRENLLSPIDVLKQAGDTLVERTGLHELEFIETHRHWFSERHHFKAVESVTMLNLVEGEEALISSPSDGFESLVVHYAETFIVPAAVGSYDIEPSGISHGNRIAVIQAYVRV